MYLHRKRRDANHGTLAKLAAQIGASHLDLSQLGDDAPDALIGFRGFNYLIEFKTGRKKLKPGQARFRRTWRGQVHLVKTGDELLALLLGDHYATKKAAPVAAVPSGAGPGTGDGPGLSLAVPDGRRSDPPAGRLRRGDSKSDGPDDPDHGRF
jgi:hypothetical protein